MLSQRHVLFLLYSTHIHLTHTVHTNILHSLTLLFFFLLFLDIHFWGKWRLKKYIQKKTENEIEKNVQTVCYWQNVFESLKFFRNQEDILHRIDMTWFFFFEFKNKRINKNNLTFQDFHVSKTNAAEK